MDKDLQTKLHESLGELYLTTVRKVYAEQAGRASLDSLSYEQYLFNLVEQECAIRRNKRIERLLRESHLPLEKNIDTFDKNRLPKKVIHQVNTLLNGEFLGYKENILVFGNPGSGKTHLVCALGHELICKGKSIYFTTCAILLQELLLAKRELKLPRVLKKLNKYNAIIIDDIGYVQQDKEEMEVLFTLLAERYERGSVMITSNLPFSKWEKIFKDPVMTTAVIDRIVHHSVILELNIPSYRMDQAKKRKMQEER
ncbi:MAG: ATP-binding protein [Actinobacteria bacterium]|nr:ATP-binding protein [Actinomycetota bacterium]